MLDSYIIEEIKRREREADAEWDRARPRVQPEVQNPDHAPVPELPAPDAEPGSTVIRIDPDEEKLSGIVIDLM